MHIDELEKRKAELLQEIEALTEREQELRQKLDALSSSKNTDCCSDSNRFRLLVEASNDWIWAADRNGFITYASPRVKEVLGMDPEELVGKTPIDLLPAEVAERILENFSFSRETGAPLDPFEFSLENKSGNLQQLEIGGRAILQADGTFLEYHGYLRDISLRKRAEAELIAHREKLEKVVDERTQEMDHAIQELTRQINKRAATEHALMESEARLRSVIDHSPLIFWTVNQKGILTFMQGQALTNLDWNSEERIGHPINELGLLGNEQQTRKNLDRIISGKNLTVEVEIDGITFENRCAPHFDAVGDISGAIGVAIDISERRKAERALETEREQLLSIFDSMDEPIYIADPDNYHLLFVNQAFSKIFETGDNGLCYQVLYGLDSPCAFCTNTIILQEEHGRSHIWEYRNRKNMRWYKCIDRAIKWPDGRMVRFELAIDITESKLAEIQLQREKKMFIAGPLVAFKWVADSDWSCEYVSPNVSQFDYAPSDFTSGLVKYSDLIHPEDQQRVLSDVKTFLEQESDYSERDYRFLTGAGLVRWLYEFSAKVRDTNGVVTHLDSYILDITDRKQAEADLMTKSDALVRSNNDLQQFAYVASHDLQEPLRSIAGYVQLLEKRYGKDLDDKAKHYINRSVAASKRMQSLINNLLEFSRVATKAKPFEPVRIEDVASEAMENLKARISDSGAKVILGALPEVSADRNQLGLLMQNLLGNAMKFIDKRPPEIHVDALRTEETDENTPEIARVPGWTIRVADNGIGIEKDYFERIFQLFQRLHTREEYPGTGMGLSISKRIVERHGGYIWVQSQVGKGTTFYFSIPDHREETT